MDINKSRAGIQQIKDYKPLLIRCDVEQFSFMDFSSIEEISDAGYQSAMEMSLELELLESSSEQSGLRETRAEFSEQIARELRNYQYNSRIKAIRSTVIADAGIENNFYPSTASYLLDDIYISAGVAGSTGSLKGRTSLGGIWDIYDSMELDLALQIDAEYSPLHFLQTAFRFRQGLDLSGSSDILGTYYVRAALEVVPYANTVNRIDIPIAGDFSFSQRLFSRIHLDGSSNVTYYKQDYIRSALPENRYDKNVILKRAREAEPSRWFHFRCE